MIGDLGISAESAVPFGGGAQGVAPNTEISPKAMKHACPECSASIDAPLLGGANQMRLLCV